MKKLILGVLTVLICIVKLQASPEINSRETFRDLLNEYAKVFQNKDMMSLCISWNNETGMEPTNYYFKIEDNSIEFEGSFFINFLQEGGLDFSTLIAYEGHNGYEMGYLKVTENEDFKIYKHLFHGYFDDEIRMEVNKKTKGIKLDFYKSLKGELIKTVECSPTIGI